MKCGLCGSGVSATEKYKKLKNGGCNRHVYYGCTKAKDKNCKCGYINEDDLIRQLQTHIDTMNLKKLPIQNKIKKEIQRFKKFQQAMTGTTYEIKISVADIRIYAKFILKEGEIEEKRELLAHLRSKIILKEKKLILENQ